MGNSQGLHFDLQKIQTKKGERSNPEEASKLTISKQLRSLCLAPQHANGRLCSGQQCARRVKRTARRLTQFTPRLPSRSRSHQLKGKIVHENSHIPQFKKQIWLSPTKGTRLSFIQLTKPWRANDLPRVADTSRAVEDILQFSKSSTLPGASWNGTNLEIQLGTFLGASVGA